MKDNRRDRLRHARHTANRERLNAMVTVARALPERPDIRVRSEVFDADPWLFNCASGTIDLRTGELKPHDPADLITKLSPVAYDPEAKAPRWERFLHEITDGNENLIGYLQREAGYALTGLTTEQILHMHLGTGANGKSVFVRSIMAAMGEYAMTTPTETLLTTRSKIPNDLAALQGARLVTASEPEMGQSLAESLIKLLTGGEPVSVRYMGAEWFQYVPKFKLWLSGNHRPQIRGRDEGIWRRIHLVPFSVTFGPDRREMDLADQLLQELPGILAWAVRGCLEWQRVGLNPPPEVLGATTEYRESEDILAAFFDDCCVLHEGAKVDAGPLYEAYRRWAEASGEKTLSKRGLGLELGRREFRPGKRSGTRFWQGIGLVSEPQQQDLV